MTTFRATIAALGVVTIAACSSGVKPAASPTTTPPTTPRATSQAPSTQPPRFSARVDNAWFPLLPGSRYVYEGVRDGEPARDEVVVTTRTRTIDGAECVVVEDKLYLSGHLAERTTDWYTQDREGNVWYYGEATAELDEHGKVVSTEGSWEAGKDGAQPGIYLPAQPAVGQTNRQEYYKGHAEDHFRVLDLAARVTVKATGATTAVLTEEWTPLEPDVLDHKYYVRGIGTVKEEAVKGPQETLTLVSYTRGSP